jgi:hypothetical protein
MINKCGVEGGMRIGRGNRNENPNRTPLYPPQVKIMKNAGQDDIST